MKIIKTIMIVMIMGLGVACALFAGPTTNNVTLAWDLPIINTDQTVITDLGGCKIYQGHFSRVYDFVSDVGYTNQSTLANSGLTGIVYFAATAYNTSGVESTQSEELVWCSFSPLNPVINTYSYNAKTGKLTLTGSAPTKNTDNSSCTGQIAGYITGYGKVSRFSLPYSSNQLSTVVGQTIIVPANSGVWYLSVCASNVWGSVGPWSSEIAFGTSTPNPPGKPRIVSISQ